MGEPRTYHMDGNRRPPSTRHDTAASPSWSSSRPPSRGLGSLDPGAQQPARLSLIPWTSGRLRRPCGAMLRDPGGSDMEGERNPGSGISPLPVSMLGPPGECAGNGSQGVLIPAHLTAIDRQTSPKLGQSHQRFPRPAVPYTLSHECRRVEILPEGAQHLSFGQDVGEGCRDPHISCTTSKGYS